MPGLLGHLARALGTFGLIIFYLPLAGYVAFAVLGFRGLPLPALPRRPGGRVRRALRISSYLARGFLRSLLRGRLGGCGRGWLRAPAGSTCPTIAGRRHSP